MNDVDDLWHIDISKLVHDRFPDIPDVEPKERVCWHGNIAAGCTSCDRQRVKDSKRKRKAQS